MKNKKPIIITSIVVLLLLVVVGVTYAFFSYESGTKSDIVTGQIYMNYEETSTISLTGVFPETKEQALARQDENGVFEFTITGRNTSKYPIYYEIDLLDGGVVTGKTEQSTKIAPDDVRIYLERDGEPLVDGMTYQDFNNRRIYVDTVPANQATNIEHKYILRMWIDENVTISDTDTSADYTTTEWNDAYTSLKVRVVGDFEYKEAATDASCFAYNVITPEPDDYDIIYDYPIITLDTSDEKVEACMINLAGMGGGDLSTDQDGYQSFCKGTGTIEEEGIKYNVFEYITIGLSKGIPLDILLSQVVVVTDITYEKRHYDLNTSEESVNSCKEVMMNYTSSDKSDTQDGFQSFCQGNGTIFNGITIYNIYDDMYDNSELDLFRYSLIERNVFIQVETPQGEIEITNYDETCGTDVIIPSIIEGLPVTRIADGYYVQPKSASNNSLKGSTLENKNSDTTVTNIGMAYESFASKGITSVKFPNTLIYIGTYAFAGNKLSEIIIPDSVTTINNEVFIDNYITNVEIGTGITSIGLDAFRYNPLVTVNIKNNPTLGEYSFCSYSENTFQTFQYGGTCAELNQYSVFYWATTPQTIITSDNNSCEYITK